MERFIMERTRFQSTPPRGERPWLLWTRRRICGFNPRPHAGSDRLPTPL